MSPIPLPSPASALQALFNQSFSIWTSQNMFQPY
jgi:hypothetical protein